LKSLDARIESHFGVFEDPRRKQRQRHDRPRFTYWRSSSRQKMPDGRLFSISGRYALSSSERLVDALG